MDGNEASQLPDFTSLSSQIAQVTPSGVVMGQYTPTNTVASACPTVGSVWQAASALPPTPDERLCGCMAQAVSCTVSDLVDDDQIEELFGILCGLAGDPCAGIALSPANGTYGAYSMCKPREQLAFALNAYHLQQQGSNNNADSCDFSGSASIQSTVSPTGACATQIEEIGNGTKPTAGGGSSGGSSSSSQGAAVGGMTQASLNIGSLQVGIYLVCAILSGAGMVLL